MKRGLKWFVLTAAGIAACSFIHAQTPLPISGDGTGATTASSAIANLGLPTISVLDFGATGNGSTDDTSAIASPQHRALQNS